MGSLRTNIQYMNKIGFKALFIYFIAVLPVYGFGQSNKDTIYFKNDNRIIGEIKILTRVSL
jgi:hypothetical protein